MNTIKELCEKLEIESSVAKQVIEFDESFNYNIALEFMDKLFEVETWDEGLKQLKDVLGDDPNGIKILSCQLKCALESYNKYIEIGIEEEIFIDTFKCFTRFINEHYASYGTYAFDREWWSVRQIAMKLMRIGALEYEMITNSEGNIISLHIPSDAVMTKQSLRKSYDMAREFFKQYFGEYANSKIICHSWIISPNLKNVLAESSNILKFQQDFIIKEVDEDANDYKLWVFKNPNLKVSEFPESTSLQRNIKKYVLEGGKMGTALGEVIAEPFL